MRQFDHEEILNQLDIERRAVAATPDGFQDEGIAGILYTDQGSCEILYTSSTPDQIDSVISTQIERAENLGCELSWKLYDHDQPSCTRERLIQFGFDAEPIEKFMVIPANETTIARFGEITADIRRIVDRDAMMDYKLICEDQTDCDYSTEIMRLASELEDMPDEMSVYVLYVGDLPVACGRTYLMHGSKFAALYGGNTRAVYRNHGFYKQILAVRIAEAISRGFPYICVDSLPTSEPILKRRGFEEVTRCQEFKFRKP